MSLSWNYLTKGFMLTRYRELIGGMIIFKWFGSKYISYFAEQADNEFVRTRIYTHDESDMKFR